jgi:hypothetical protein
VAHRLGVGVRAGLAQKARKRANHDNIFVYSRQGGPMPVLEAYAEALNRAIGIHGRAIALTTGLGARL